MNVIRMLINLLKRQAFYQIHRHRRLGQAEQIVATGGKFVTAIFGPLTRCPRKEKPGAFAPGGGNPYLPGHAPSGLNSGKLAMRQLFDPPRTLVAHGKALEGALDAQAALV